MNKTHIPFIFAFVFLVALSFVLPSVLNLKTASTAASSAQTSSKTESLSEEAAKEEFIASANSFYYELCALDNVGPFDLFYNEGQIKADLMLINAASFLEETTELLNSAKDRVVEFKQNNVGALYYSGLTSSDNTTNLLNALYSKLSQCFGL